MSSTRRRKKSPTHHENENEIIAERMRIRLVRPTSPPVENETNSHHHHNHHDNNNNNRFNYYYYFSYNKDRSWTKKRSQESSSSSSSSFFVSDKILVRKICTIVVVPILLLLLLLVSIYDHTHYQNSIIPSHYHPNFDRGNNSNSTSSNSNSNTYKEMYQQAATSTTSSMKHVPDLNFGRVVIYLQNGQVVERLDKLHLVRRHYHHEYNIRRRRGKIEISDPMLRVNPGEETIEQPSTSTNTDIKDETETKENTTNCVPMQQWQIANHPTCNTVHELDLQQSGRRMTMRHERKRSSVVLGGKLRLGLQLKLKLKQLNFADSQQDMFQLYRRGWFRHTWKGTIGGSKQDQETVAVKTLRLERDYLYEYYELHRRESIAMERLTPSPYIIDIYSFCGQSTVNEYANFIDGFQDFKTFARQLRNKNGKVLQLKLQIAAMIALGVQHIHEIDGEVATMAHYDINPMNVVITAHGVPKINDFNVAEFMYWDQEKNSRCGFKGRFHEPWWRSPEEMIWAENLKNNDTTNLPLLDGHTPRGPTKKERMKFQANQVKRGIPPIIDKIYATSDEPAIVAMREAVIKCYHPDPQKRSSAREIATGLLKVLNETMNEK